MSQPFRSFIETQFPVSKLSKESYKERKAGASQTLTGLGKWWGRKPLILVRATILGLLMPSSKNPQRDMEIFLKILTMDEDGLWERKEENLLKKAQYGLPEEWAAAEVDNWEKLGYDEKLTHCLRPENIEGPSQEAWIEINEHLGTQAKNLQELIEQLGVKQFGHRPRVGDSFCGGGSIPFEAARIGCEAYGSDLNPAAALLTWAGLHIIGGGATVQEKVKNEQKRAFELANNQIQEWGIEENEQGWKAEAYLYCIEAKSPATGYWVPLAPNWIISEKYRICGQIRPDHKAKRYHIDIISDATDEQMKAALIGTVQDSSLVCPETKDRYSLKSIRGDGTENGLRLWENEDLVPRKDDVFQERLYCVRYAETYRDKGKDKIRRHYLAPGKKELENEAKTLDLLKERFDEWQNAGFIPSAKIPQGDKTDEPIRTRGWSYWHHLFHPRQLLGLGLFMDTISKGTDLVARAGGLLAVGAGIDRYSRLCGWDPHFSKGPGATRNVFFNQALNTQYYYGCRNFAGIIDFLVSDHLVDQNFELATKIQTIDARSITTDCDFWITDPPYADAVNYHELADFFLAWYEKQIEKNFPEWYSDSKSALAVKGSGADFNQAMVDCYSNLAYHMPANGAQVVMFTHQDSKVWADLALILWASGLQVTAAWTIQTETAGAGIKQGNYVQGTVIMVLRKQQTFEMVFLSDIQSAVEREVKKELDKMNQLDDKEDPNFGDTDYQLAAYVAALRVLTSYRNIEDLDIKYELSRQRPKGEISEIQKIIDSAVKIACENLVPGGFSPTQWRMLNGEERFYIKALEIQSHGEYRTGVFQELARGFGLKDYKGFLFSGKANETRLANASELGRKQLGDDEWGKSLVRNVLYAIKEVRSEGNVESGRNWLWHEVTGFWEERKRIIELLEYIQKVAQHLEAWGEDVKAAHLLEGRLRNEGV